MQASEVPNTGMALTMVTSINLLLYVLLFVLFMIFFGYPSIVQYQKQETIITSTEKKTNGIEAPAVTIVTNNNITGYGYKTKTNTTSSMACRFTMTCLLDHCQEINQPDLGKCMFNDSFALTDFLTTASYVWRESTMGKVNLTQWTEDVGSVNNGRVFTWDPQRTITRYWDDMVLLSVKRNLKYYIFVHDIDFYLISLSPLGATRSFWHFDGNTMKNHFREIALVQHKRLNLDRQPCEEDEDYRMIDCVKESLAEQVGCRLPWEKKTRQDRKVCTEREEFQKHENMSAQIMLDEIDYVKGMTGCLTPCSYKEYKFLNMNPKLMTGYDTFVPDDQIAVGLWAVSRNTEFKEEVSMII